MKIYLLIKVRNVLLTIYHTACKTWSLACICGNHIKLLIDIFFCAVLPFPKILSTLYPCISANWLLSERKWLPGVHSIAIMTRAIRTHLNAGSQLDIELDTFYSCGRNSRVAKLSRLPFMNVQAITFGPLFVDLFQAHNERRIQGDRSNWINHFQNLSCVNSRR